MKRPLFFILLFAALAICSYGSVREVIDEDFARMPSGTPEVPWSLAIDTDADGLIPARFTTIPGWIGIGVHQAGGACAMQSYTDDYGRMYWGRLATPGVYMGGEVQVTFRAKRLPGSRGNMWLSIVSSDGETTFDDRQLELSTRWASFTYTFPEIPADQACRVCFGCEGGGVVIDDVRVLFDREIPPCPMNVAVENISETSFTARWDNMNADSYLVNVFSLTPHPVVESGTIGEGFDNPDASVWLLNDVRLTGDPDQCGLAAPAVVFETEDAEIVLPALPQDMNHIDFFVKSSDREDGAKGESVLRVDIQRGMSGIWIPVRYITAAECAGTGRIISIDDSHIGYGAQRMRIAMESRGHEAFFIDDIEVSYATGPITEYAYLDLNVEGNEASFDNLNPEGNYYINVRAVEDGVAGKSSGAVWFDAIEGLTVADVHSEVVRPGVVGMSWKPMSHAERYSLDISRTVRAGEWPLNGVTILEDEFDNGPEATLWRAEGAIWSPEGIGTAGGLIYSPRLNLGCNAGRGFDVDITVRTTADSYLSNGALAAEAVRIMVLNDIYDKTPLAFSDIECGSRGELTAKIAVDTRGVRDLSDVIISVRSLSGAEFYIDRIWVSQTLLPGETLTVPVASGMSATEHQVVLEDLSTDADHLISITAIAERGGHQYRSIPTTPVTVNTNTGVESIRDDAIPQAVQEYDIYGRPATSSTRLRISPVGKMLVKPGDSVQKTGLKCEK